MLLEIRLDDRSGLFHSYQLYVPYCWNQSIQNQLVMSAFLLRAEWFEVGGERCEYLEPKVIPLTEYVLFALLCSGIN